MGVNQSSRNDNPDYSSSQVIESARDICDIDQGHLKDDETSNSQLRSKRGTLVVVKEAEQLRDWRDDPIYLRLNKIPFFNPIFLNKEKIGWSKEGEEARGRLNSEAALKLCSLIQKRVRSEKLIISNNQNFLTNKIKDADKSLKSIAISFTDRQKKFERHSESLSRITDFAHLLAKCQAVLNDCKRTSILLNQLLPETERLENFTWEK